RDARLRGNLRHATQTIRAKRAAAVAEVADWAELREAGRRIKDHTLRHLDHYLVRLEESVTAAGGTVHWAADADEANRIVTGLVRETGEREVVKVKSMATQETGLNEALEAAGIRAYETDLAELIVQLGRDRPSHILVPAIHRNRGEIRGIFAREMAAWGRPAPDGLTDSPAELAEAARLPLRGIVLVVLRRLPGCVRRVGGGRQPGGARRRGRRAEGAVSPRVAGVGGRHREGRADLPGPGGVPAAPAARVDGRVPEPVHVDVDG